jgi:serine/threonine-protein kinase
MPATADRTEIVIGRYVIFDEIAAGGMATVHLGRQVGAVGFARTVAIKRLHAHLSRDDDFTAMFLDEARLAARIRHPNVVQVLDVVHESGELFLVMEYVQGESFSRLCRAVKPGSVPPRVAVTVVAGVLHGLHAAHEATTEHGEPLHIVHRDVSPQNIMVGTDGVGRVLDFGVAKAVNRAQTTRDGAIKGKISYMAPEQLLSESVDRRADVYSAAVVLWEAVTGQRLFDGDNQGRVVRKILDEEVPAPSSIVPGLPKALDEAVLRGLEKDARRRFQTAREFASALERCMPTASLTEVGEWVESLGGAALGDRARRIKEIESRSDIHAAQVTAATKIERGAAQLAGPTVPQAFAVMSKKPAEPAIRTDIDVPSVQPPSAEGSGVAHAGAPESTARVRAEAPASQLAADGATQAAADLAPGKPERNTARRLQVPSPFAGMPVQTLAVSAPLASLDPVPVPTPREFKPDASVGVAPVSEPPPPRRRGAARYVLLVLVLLAAGAVVTWLALHGRP